MNDMSWIRLISLAILTGSIAASIGSVAPITSLKASFIALAVTASSTLAWSRDRAERRTRWERSRRTVLSFVGLVVFIETIHLSEFGLVGALDRLAGGLPILVETPVLWGFAIAVSIWFTIQMTLDDLRDLGEPWDVSENGTPSLDRLHFRFMLGALVVVACGGITLADASSLSGSSLKPGVIWPIALYFPVGLTGLVGARRLSLRRTWKHQHVLSDSEFLSGWRRSSLVWIAAFWSLLFMVPIGGEAPVAEVVDGIFTGVSSTGQWLADRIVPQAEEPEIEAEVVSQDQEIKGAGGELNVTWWTIVFLSVPALLMIAAIWMLWRGRKAALAATTRGIRSLLRKVRNLPRRIVEGIKAILTDFRTMLKTPQERKGTLKVLRRSTHPAIAAAKSKSRTRPWEPTDTYSRRIAKAYREFVGRADSTPDLSHNETPRERMKRISMALPLVADSGESLTRLFEEVRYSPHPMGAVQADQATRLLRIALDALKMRSRTEQGHPD